MKYSEDAKFEIEKNLIATLKGVSLDKRDLADVEKELRSTYYEAAETEAISRGASIVTSSDVRAAMADMGSPTETARCIMKSHAGSVKRAGFLPRLAAYVIDLFAMSAIIYTVLIPVGILGVPFLGDFYLMYVNINGYGIGMHAPSVTGRSPVEMAVLVTIAAVTITLSIIIFFCYNFVQEGRYGYTIGKRIMGLRVLKSDGAKIGYRDAFIRNLTKYFEFVLFFDALMMPVLFSREKQRGSDRIADTIVVHVRSQ